jgi:hypothetical protein
MHHAPEQSESLRRYPVHQRLLSGRGAEAVFGELERVLQLQSIDFTPGTRAMSLLCTMGDLRFEAEVVKVPRLDMHGVHFHRVRGDAVLHQQLCSVLLDLMRL